MRVLMLGWEFPPYFAGGVGVVCRNLTQALARRGVGITYFMPSGPKGVSSPHLRLLVANNLIADDKIDIRTVESGLLPYASLDEYAAFYRQIIEQSDSNTMLYGHDLLEEMQRFAQKVVLLVKAMGVEFDVIHAHDWTTFPAAIALKKTTGKPMIVHVHITEFDKTGGEHADPRVYAIEKAGMDAADIVIGVSNLVKNRCVYQYHIPPEKVRVIYNAVDVGERKALEERFHIGQTDKVVLFLGRVTLQKGPDYFVEAAKRVLDVDPNVKFIMAGSGDMLPRMIERAASLGIGHRMIFPGFVSREQGEMLYRLADVFVMPSVSEPFGIVPLEAMAQGTPVIISRQSGVSEVLKHALKVDFWDIDDIANKVIAALSYPMLRHELRHHGHREAISLTWENAAEQVERAYREVSSAW